jgi:hypothetical protein
VPIGVEVLVYLLLALGFLYLLYIVYLILCKKYVCGKLLEAQICYLCGSVVNGSDWCNGKHRKECMVKHKASYESNALQEEGFREEEEA